MINGAFMDTNCRCSDLVQQVYVGDFPPPRWDYDFPEPPSQMPKPIEIVGHTVITDQTLQWVMPQADPEERGWNTKLIGDQLTLSVDVPGVRTDSITIEIEDHIVRVVCTRFDSGVIITKRCDVNRDYDPATAIAVLDSGVLTISLKKFREKIVHRVTVQER